MKQLEKQWIGYREQVVPKDAPPIQVIECERAFYGGAAALWSLVMRHVIEPSDDELARDGEKIQKLTEIMAELVEFGHRFDKAN